MSSRFWSAKFLAAGLALAATGISSQAADEKQKSADTIEEEQKLRKSLDEYLIGLELQ